MRDMAVRTIPLTKGLVALLDEEDFEAEHACHFKSGRVWRGRICDVKWQVYSFLRLQYAVTSLRYFIGDRLVKPQLRLHRVVMDAPAGTIIDHINGNGLDNRRCNLRVATHAENIRNARFGSGASNFRGVSWSKASGKWTAEIWRDYKKTYIGLFSSEEDAARAYDLKAVELHGPFARLNFPEAVSA